MRTCDEMTELLSAALDGELTADEHRELDEHLASCPACGALLAELGGLRKAVGGPEEAPEGLAGRVMDQIRAEGAPEADNVTPLPVKRRKWTGWAATAAVAAVVILGASVLPGRIGLSRTDNSTGAAYAPNSTANSSPPAEADSAQTPSMYDSYNTPRTVPDTPPAYVEMSIPGTADIPVISLDPSGGLDTPDPGAVQTPTGAFLPPESTAPVIDTDGDAPYCGVLVLTDEPLPEVLEVLDAKEDEEGCLTYVVAADSFFMIADELEEEYLSNFTYYDDEIETDPTAAYGLIIVGIPME